MPESDFEVNLRQLRREKLTQIVALGQQAFPNSYAFTHTVPAVRAFDTAENTAEVLAERRIPVSVAGRLMAIRIQGKAGFAQLQQGGERLQIYVRKDAVGEDQFALYKLLDLGDHIGVRGHLFRTRTGELTVHVEPVEPVESVEPIEGAPPAAGPALTFLTKAMLALPDKYHGLEDTELRYRQRYVDLFMNTGQTPAATQPQPPVILSEGAAAAEGPAVPPTQNLSSRPEQETASSSLAEWRDPRISTAAASHPPVILSEGAAAVEGPAVPPAAEAPLNVRDVFVKRAAILRAIRKFFDDRDYLEVETPMLHTVAGGAAARPFTTHHNALDIPLSLRIAPELFLKRLVVGGLDRVYEINRNFRNEGVSTRHNPEFTMLEFYQAYSNYEDLMDLTEELIPFVAKEVNGTTICNFNGNAIDLSKWTKLSMREAIIRWWPIIASEKPDLAVFSSRDLFMTILQQTFTELESLRKYPENDELPDDVNDDYLNEFLRQTELATQMVDLSVANLELSKGVVIGKVIANLFERLAEPHLIQPTIIYDFPLAVSPLSKQKPNDPDWVERFEFYIGGFEVGNAFSELNDPDEQRARFEAQVADKDPESMAEVDEDYVRALSYGLPPTAGEGIGIDRLTMILTGAKSIRDVILFPLMRPHKNTPTEPAP